MTTAPDQLQYQLTDLKARLEINEAKQGTTAQRFDELYKALVERLDAKDKILAGVRDQSEWTLKQNDTLLKQIGLRWNLLTGLTTLVSLAFALVFTYQIWRVEQVMDTKKELDAAAARAASTTKLLAENTKAYSQILGVLARADTLMTESNREFLRAEYGVAASRAKEATDALKSGLQSAGEDFTDLEKRTALYASSTCRLDITNRTAPTQDSHETDAALSPAALRGALRNALFTAYDLHARGAFFSAQRSNLRSDGMMLLAIDDSQWAGYHWIGLAAEDAGFTSEATECFRRSVDKNQVGNKDFVNLAELSFIHSDFPTSVRYSDQYLHPIGHRFTSSLDVVAQFYFSSAGFLARDSEAMNKIPPEAFRRAVDKLPDFTLEGTFSPSDLNRYLTGPDFAKVPENQRKEVIKSASCLTLRKCKD